MVALSLRRFMWHISSYPSGLPHWHWGNRMIAPVPVKQPWRIWVKIGCYHTRTKLIKVDGFGMYSMYTTCLCNFRVSNTVSSMPALTHWGWDKMAAILQTAFSNAFSWMQIALFWLKFHWQLSARVKIVISQHWFRWWPGTKQALSHYLNQWWPSLLIHICASWPQWVDVASSISQGLWATVHRRASQNSLPYCGLLLSTLRLRKKMVIILQMTYSNTILHRVIMALDCITWTNDGPVQWYMDICCCLSGKLCYLQHNCVGDTIVYQQDSNVSYMCLG